ncbi:MAG TPA: hypothetical protein VGE27_14600 [Gemmatimonas sp.]|uniref:hypothetical protein n=1 Tax=Gemmatimonas sp. TaxID=1962908 RepID=UPI002ED7848B
MTAVALGFLLTGLVLGVYAMLYGTERSVQPVIAPHERRSEHNPAAEPSPTLNLASLAAFAVGFGLTGYLLTRTNAWAWYWQLLVALKAGGAAYALQSLLIARWAIPGARADHVDERFLLQGTLAQVTQGVATGGRGQLRYALDGREYLLPAQHMDGGALEMGSDVVIDRVEDGVAYAEPWDAVERRL